MQVRAGRLIGTLLVAFAPCLTPSARAQAPAAAPPASPPATAAPEPPAPAVKRDRREVAREEAERILQRTMMPAAMTPERFAAFLAAVDPVLSSDAELAAQFASYAEQTKTIIESCRQRIADRLPAAYDFDAARERFVARPNPELVQTLTLRGKAMSQILAAERALLRAVMLATPPERKVRFVEERLAWIDERTPRDGLIPSTKLTLFEIVARARLSPESIAAIEPILVAHGDKLASLREARNTSLREADLRRARIETDAGTLWRFGIPERMQATEALLVAVDDAEFSSEIAIRELHFESMQRLRGRLALPEGRRIVEEWQRSVHPELFDDERLLSKLVDAVVALPSSPPEVDLGIVDAVESAFAKLEPLARDASRAADLVLPRLVDRSDEAVQKEIAARLSVLAAQAKRRTAIRDLLTRIRSMASIDDAAVLARFDSLAETLAALERADGFDRTSLQSLAAALVAHAHELEQRGIEADEREAREKDAPGHDAAGNETVRQPSSNPSSGAPAAQPRNAPGGQGERPPPSDTRPSGGSRDESSGGNRSGRGSRRQQGGPNGVETG